MVLNYFCYDDFLALLLVVFVVVAASGGDDSTTARNNIHTGKIKYGKYIATIMILSNTVASGLVANVARIGTIVVAV